MHIMRNGSWYLSCWKGIYWAAASCSRHITDRLYSSSTRHVVMSRGLRNIVRNGRSWSMCHWSRNDHRALTNGLRGLRSPWLHVGLYSRSQRYDTARLGSRSCRRWCSLNRWLNSYRGARHVGARSRRRCARHVGSRRNRSCARRSDSSSGRLKSYLLRTGSAVRRSCWRLFLQDAGWFTSLIHTWNVGSALRSGCIRYNGYRCCCWSWSWS